MRNLLKNLIKTFKTEGKTSSIVWHDNKITKINWKTGQIITKTFFPN